jgi:TPR repeat protein
MFVLKPQLTVKFLLVLAVVCVILLPSTVASAYTTLENPQDWNDIDISNINEINSVKEIKELKAQAESGDIDAQFRLGKEYYGFRAEEVKTVGWYWYQKAASRGCARANYEIAMFLSDVENNINRQEAIPYLEKASQQGNAEAFIALGDRYAIGEGVKMNPLKALSLYKAAGDRSNDDGSFDNGTGYFLAAYAYYTGQVKPSWNSVTGSPYDELSTGDAYSYTEPRISIDQQRALKDLRNNYYRHIIKIPVDKKLAFEYFEKAAIASAGEGGNYYTKLLSKLYIKEGGLVNWFKSLYWDWSSFFYELKLLERFFYPEWHSPARQKREQRQLRC